METARFDQLTRSLTSTLSRRTLAGALSLSALALPGHTEARKKRKKHKKKKKPTFNSFGCVNFGGFCKGSDQCCSGICEGQKCQAHDVGTCQAGQDSCAAVTPIACTTDDNESGFCLRTTGGAPYCAASGDGTVACLQCDNDADCVGHCGAGAACVACLRCALLGSQTACAGASPGSCGVAP